MTVYPLSDWLRLIGACPCACKYADVHGYVRGELEKALDELPEALPGVHAYRGAFFPEFREVFSTSPRREWTQWLRDEFGSVEAAIKAEKEAPL